MVFIRGVTRVGLDIFRNNSLVRMFKFWECISSLREDRLVKVAYREMIKDNWKDSWLNQVRKRMNICGMS